MEQVHQVFWGLPTAADLGGLWLGVLYGRTLPFSGGCKCLWWHDHFCRLSHLRLDKRKLPGVPDHQGMCHITAWKRNVIGYKNFLAVTFWVLIKKRPRVQTKQIDGVFQGWKARQLLCLISIHLLISLLWFSYDEMCICELSMKDHPVCTEGGEYEQGKIKR